MTYKGTFFLAHRLAYQFAHGKFNQTLFVCHTCDNRSCVNPAHLFLGSALDNIRDMHTKGRNRCGVGESHGKAKLSEENVIAIRARHAKGETQRSLASEFHVHYTTIADIVHRRHWKHI
jgi:hypothetical protein